MTTTIVSILLTFILTGVVANLLAHRWQYRNWINQQRFLGEEQEYLSLKLVWEELTTLSSRRLWCMRRLLLSLGTTDEEGICARLTEYEVALSEWNEKFNSLVVRLTMHASWSLEQELEVELQPSFVTAGQLLERVTTGRLRTGRADPRELGRLERQLNRLSRQVFVLSRDTLRVVQMHRTRTYYGIRVTLTPQNLERIGTWELLKALFKPGIPQLPIGSANAHLPPPLRSRE